MKIATIFLASIFFCQSISGQTIIEGKYRTEGWDMFWLAKTKNPYGAPRGFSSRSRTVDFNLDEATDIASARLEFDYFDGDFLIGIEQEHTSFHILIDGQIVDSVDFQSNSVFEHKTIDVSKWVIQDRFSLPVTFKINQPKSADGVIIARTYLVINEEEFIKGQYRTEGWDMFWIAKTKNALGAPEGFSSRSRTVDFNIDLDHDLTEATLEFDYFDGDFLIGIEQEHTSFYIKIDGQIVDSVEFQNNTSFIHKSVDLSNWLTEDRYSLPVTFSINSPKSQDGAIIARPYLVVHSENSTAIENKEEEITDSYVISPNPTNNTIEVQFENHHNERITMTLFTSDGKSLQHIPSKLYGTGTHSTQINMEQYTPGIYYLRVQKSNQQSTKKIILN